MSVTAAQVKELRVKTGAGMMDCKKALTETGGDFDKAVENRVESQQKVSLEATSTETARSVLWLRSTAKLTSSLETRTSNSSFATLQCTLLQ